MTRLAATEKMQYFPTPLHLVRDIAKIFEVYSYYKRKAVLLDPCAGAGAALQELAASANGLEGPTYGVELDAERAKEAKARLSHVLHGPYENLEMQKNVVSVLFDNPPYTEGAEGRQEIEFLHRDLEYLKEGGIGIWIVPEHVYNRVDWSTLQVKYLACYRFPESEYQAFKQVVAIYQKGRVWYYQDKLDSTISDWPPVPCSVDPSYQEAKPSFFRMLPVNLQDLTSQSVWEQAGWQNAVKAPKIASLDHPPLPLRQGHQALLMAAGAFDGTEIGNYLVRGVSERRTEREETEEATFIREYIDASFTLLNLKTLELKHLRASTHKDEIQGWLEEHATQLATHVEKSLPATTSSIDAEPTCRAPKGGTWYTPQKQAIAAIKSLLRTQPSVMLAGEMGVGKTSIISAALAEQDRKIVVLCPGHLVDKWHAEFEEVTGQKAAVIENISDLDTQAKCLIISKEKAKLGAPWRNISVSGNKPARCPSCGVAVTLQGNKKTFCPECGEACWQVTRMGDKPGGKARWPLADVIAKKLKGQYILVLDEGHQYANADSDQSQAAMRLAAHAHRRILATGTMWDGKASGLFLLLYMSRPEFREIYKFSEMQKFVETHGTLETILTERESHGAYGAKRGLAKRVREIPGIDPGLFRHLIGWSVFVRLQDFPAGSLPAYSEHVILTETEQSVSAYTNNCLAESKRLRREDPQLAAKLFSEALNRPDGEAKEFDEAEEIDLSLKELALLRVVEDEVAEGRQVVVYCCQVHVRPVLQRLQLALEAQGLSVGILRQDSAAPRKRDKVLQKLAKEHQVILTNGQLVETGLDLYWASTVIQYGIELSSKRLRQSLRRSYRLGQKNEVRVYIIGAKETPQEAYTKYAASKVRAASLLEDDPISALANHANDDFGLLTSVRTALGL